MWMSNCIVKFFAQLLLQRNTTTKESQVCYKLGVSHIQLDITLLARDAFVRTNRRAIAMMFIRLSVYPSVRLSGTGVHCDHTVHFSADFTLRLDSPMFWLPMTPKHVHQLPAVFFQFHLEERWGIDDGMNVQTTRDISRTVEDRR